MQDISGAGRSLDQERYWRLDRFLLYLITSELGYLVLAVLTGVVLMILPGSTARLNSLGATWGLPWPLLPYMAALPVNIGCGLASLVLNIKGKHAGYPGTGAPAQLDLPGEHGVDIRLRPIHHRPELGLRRLNAYER